MQESLSGLRKILTFGLIGAIGCLAGAIVGEVFLFLARAAPPPPPQVDVCFLLDVTASMQPQIDGVRRGITSFADELSKRKLDSRFGVVAFRDRFRGEEPEILSFRDGAFTADTAEFRQQVERLRAQGGGDAPESSLDAVVTGTEQPFRKDATRVLVLITDAPPKVPDKSTPSVSAAEEALRKGGINQLHLVIDRVDENIYARLQEAAPGEIFPLDSISGGIGNFDRLLPIVGAKIAERTLKGLQSTSGLARSTGALLFILCVWTALLVVGLSLALICGQNVYLHRPAWNPRDATIGIIGAVGAGVVAGGLGQLLYGIWPDIAVLEFIARVAAWAVLGCLVGRGMALFVPNLAPRPALIGGAIGGALAAIAFVIMSAIMGEVLGRLLGAIILGFCIGAMVALIEYAVRSAWLEVRYGQKEVIHVSLGATPVRVGSNTAACTVFARDARPIALEYKLTDGKIFCTDYATEMTSLVEPGAEKQVGNVVVTVRTSAHAAPVATSGVRAPVAPPPPPGAARTPPPIAPTPLASAPIAAPAPATTAAPAPPQPARAGILPAPPPPRVPRATTPTPVAAAPSTPVVPAPSAAAPPAASPAPAPAAQTGVIPPPPPPPLPKKP
ncbi:MAG TPA: vWA domain-containing protein [Planctomycetaceae bacterium]|nr:vWA domain-containing protein [Planctomycetaceae bacterium]